MSKPTQRAGKQKGRTFWKPIPIDGSAPGFLPSFPIDRRVWSLGWVLFFHHIGLFRQLDSELLYLLSHLAGPEPLFRLYSLV